MSMKLIIAAILLVVFNITAMSQKKSEVTANRIKSVEVSEEKTEKGKTTTQKESETTYDVYGNVIDEKEYKDGKLDKHSSYQYDSGNNKIKEIEYDAAGKVAKTIKYKYQGNLKTEKIVYDSNGKIKSKKIYTYVKF